MGQGHWEIGSWYLGEPGPHFERYWFLFKGEGAPRKVQALPVELPQLLLRPLCPKHGPGDLGTPDQGTPRWPWSPWPAWSMRSLACLNFKTPLVWGQKTLSVGVTEQGEAGGGWRCTRCLLPFPPPSSLLSAHPPAWLGTGSSGHSHTHPQPCPPGGDTLATWGPTWT